MKNRIRIKYKNIRDNVKIPEYQTAGSQGLDLHAHIEEPITIHPGEYKRIPCGFSISIPEGIEAQIRPRSGLAAKYGITVLNSPGTIDSDYRGEIQVILINLGKNDFTVNPHDRIAQMVFSKVIKVELVKSSILDKTKRNRKGFGHTGR